MKIRLIDGGEIVGPEMTRADDCVAEAKKYLKEQNGLRRFCPCVVIWDAGTSRVLGVVLQDCLGLTAHFFYEIYQPTP